MILGHGVGSRGDLPLELWMFTWASAAVLVASFVALGVLWTEPRLVRAVTGRGRGQPGAGAGQLDAGATVGPELGALAILGRVAALALFALSLWAGLVGADSAGNNLLPVTLYVIVWVGAQLLNGLVGDIWRVVSPITTLAAMARAVTRRLGIEPVAAPAGLGQWPAAAGLAVFLFYELAHPSGSSPRTLAWMLVVHTVVSVALALRWGVDWIADNEPFAALFSMLAHMGVVGSRDGRLAVRPPVAGLSLMPVRAGTLAVLLVVLGGTTFDGFKESEAGRSLLGRTVGWGGAVTLTVGLAGSVLVIAALYGIGVWWVGRQTTVTVGEAAHAFAPSLVPIVFGYAIAHYAQLLIDEVQSFTFRLSDPAGRGWDLIGLADGQIDFGLVSFGVIAWIQVLAIILGHLGAVIVAHDRAIELFASHEALRTQFAMLLVMVAYSSLGLWLLLNA